MDLDVIVRIVQASQRTVVVTGSGMSAESGITSFRQALVGEWGTYDVRDLATPQAFARNPKLVWRWYDFRRHLVEAAIPSAAHHALVDLEQRIPEFLLISLAIDGLHWRAGSRDMVELNGCVQRTRCVENGHLGDWDEEGDVPPHCQRCGSMLRPDVVLLGEGFARHDVSKARHTVEQCDTMLFVGEISASDPVAQFPFMAHRAGAKIVTISNDATSIFSVMADHLIQAAPSQVLPELVARLNNSEGQ
jgi:NAD-dependent deacetylase